MNTFFQSFNHSLRSGMDGEFFTRIKLPEWALSNSVKSASSIVGTSLTMIFIIYIYVQYLAPSIVENSFLLMPQGGTSSGIVMDTLQLQKYKKEHLEATKVLETKMNQISKSPYIVINSTQNEFKLYSGGNLVREGICSTGSYVKLELDEKKQWVFRTPKGMLKIRNKTKAPVWKKPDWAFVEEGKPIPSPNHPTRFEYGVLGDYSLALGDGYLIHGTLYQRLLGMPVTHGCVRLGDKDLEAVYRTLRIGDRVFIY